MDGKYIYSVSEGQLFRRQQPPGVTIERWNPKEKR